MKVKRIRIGRLMSGVPTEYDNVRIEIEYEIKGEEEIPECIEDFTSRFEDIVLEVIWSWLIRKASILREQLLDRKRRLQKDIEKAQKEIVELEEKKKKAEKVGYKELADELGYQIARKRRYIIDWKENIERIDGVLEELKKVINREVTKYYEIEKILRRANNLIW